MSPANGHAQQDCVPTFAPTAAPLAPGVLPIPVERIKELVAALEVPFDPSQIEWRVMRTTKNQQPMRGQVVPYADQRAYTDRLNALFTPAGWTRKYTIQTSANFERSRDQKIIAKVLVTCGLTIFGLGSHSATGEEWADNDNAGTRLDTKVASIDALEVVKAKTGRVCPLDCERGTRASGDRCVKITCDSDEVLGSNGTCRPKPERAPRVVTPQERRAASPAGGRGRCFAFNGRQVCE